MGLLMEFCQLVVALLTIIAILAIPVLIPGYVIYRLIKRLIRYNAECQDRYARRWQAEQDLDDLEAEVNYMKDHDWSKEP